MGGPSPKAPVLKSCEVPLAIVPVMKAALIGSRWVLLPLVSGYVKPACATLVIAEETRPEHEKRMSMP